MSADVASEQINPTPMAVYGLIFLALSPFAWLTVNMRMVISAVVLAGYIAAKPKLLGAQNNLSARILDSSRLREIYIWLGLLFLHAILCSIISATILLRSGEVSQSDFFDRSSTQLGSLLLAFLQIGCGYHMAKYIKPATLRKVIYATFWVSLAASVYQTFSSDLGLPYLGREVFDPRVGLRPGGLSGEPKALSSFLVAVVLLLLMDGSRRHKHRSMAALFRISGIILGFHFFLKTSSGNGFFSVAILAVIYFVAFPTPRKAVFGTCVLLAVLAIVPFDRLSLSDFSIRESHQSILDNIWNLDLGLFDDLIALPMMAWLGDPLSLLIGFGPGLMHFFASRYMDQATWLTGTTYIEGNVGAIMYISNYGLFVFLALFVYVFRKARQNFSLLGIESDRPIQMYILSSFVLGAAIAGNVSCPFYLSIGWILGTARKKLGTDPNGNALAQVTCNIDQ